MLSKVPKRSSKTRGAASVYLSISIYLRAINVMLIPAANLKPAVRDPNNTFPPTVVIDLLSSPQSSLK